jgi:hypothetical protein
VTIGIWAEGIASIHSIEKRRVAQSIRMARSRRGPRRGVGPPDDAGHAIFLGIPKPHAGLGLLDVERAIGVASVPVEDAEGGVAWRLDFGGDDSGPESVADAAREIDAIASLDGDRLQVGEDAGPIDVGEVAEETLAIDVVAHTAVEHRARLGLEDDPRLGLEMRAWRRGSERGVGVHLDRKVLVRVQVLHEERESPLARELGRTEHLSRMGGDDVAKCEARPRPAGEMTSTVLDLVGKIRQLPALADASADRNPLPEATEPIATPRSVLQDRLEEKGLDHGHGLPVKRSCP